MVAPLLRPRQVEPLAERVEERNYKAGAPLFNHGDPGDAMYIVVTGAVEIFFKNDTGEKILLETARLLVPYRGRLARTVRFVATDAEELGNLAGARAYARLIRAEATAGGFALVAGVDDEQSGWNCQAEGACGEPTPAPLFDVFACGDQYAFPELADRVAATVARYGGLEMTRDCIGANSDHYALWEIGVPAVVIGEHRPFFNPHFDQNGGDTFDRIDQAYFVGVARPSIAFQAELVGITP